MYKKSILCVYVGGRYKRLCIYIVYSVCVCVCVRVSVGGNEGTRI